MNVQLAQLIPPAIIVILTFGLVYSIRYTLRFAWQKRGITPERIDQRVRWVQLGLYTWLLLLAALSVRGWIGGDTDLPLRLLWIMVPPLAVVLWLLIDPRFVPTLKAIPESWIIYAQTFRFLLDLFLYLGYQSGFVPMQMTFLWLNFDFTVGLTAPLAGYVFFSKRRYHRFEGILWNAFGIALLLHNFMIAFISYPGPQQVFLRWPDSSFLADFPYSWIVGFLIPLALGLHALSLKQLLNAPRGQRRTFNLHRSRQPGD
jgi:hypothetical protein